MRCHLVYSVPPADSKLDKASRKLKELLQNMGIPVSAIGNRHRISTDTWPDKSPYANTKHIYKGLSSVMPTFLYHLTEKSKIRFQPDDIMIGHPLFPASPGSSGVTNLSIGQTARPKIFALISPLHCNVNIETSHINKAYLDSIDKLMPYADILFTITGQYWWDQWDSSPYSHWKSKMVRLDMAVNSGNFPRIKKKFNKPGKRGYLYIGRNDNMKGVSLLSKLLSEVGEYPRGWIGSGSDIPGVSRIAKSSKLTPDYMSRLAEKFDFFITTGIADPNPTTILESMAWGFPVICTPQSGYYETSFLKNVFHDDIPGSLKVLKDLQYADEEELVRMADEARNTVERDYNWDKFVSTILNTIENFGKEQYGT